MLVEVGGQLLHSGFNSYQNLELAPSGGTFHGLQLPIGNPPYNSERCQRSCNGSEPLHGGHLCEGVEAKRSRIENPHEVGTERPKGGKVGLCGCWDTELIHHVSQYNTALTAGGRCRTLDRRSPVPPRRWRGRRSR